MKVKISKRTETMIQMGEILIKIIKLWKNKKKKTISSLKSEVW